MPTQLQNLSDETRDQLAELALKISGNKDTRKGFLGLIKKVAPATPIPEIDAESVIDARLAEERKAREKVEKDFNDYRLGNDLAAKKNTVREKFGMSDEDMKKMEEMMTKGELPADYNWAAPLFKQQTTSTEPTNYGTGGYGPLDLEKNAKTLDGLMDDTDNWALRTAHGMIDDIQRKGRSTAF